MTDSTDKYQIPPDITSNGRTLLYDNEKFNKHGKTNAKQEQRWSCTKAKGQKCRAACSTKEVNGVLMMKILMAEHTHISPEYPFVADISSTGRTLLYDNEKFNKHGKPNAKQEQRWICTKFVGQKCRAACSTKEVNGILMMKIIIAEHTHTSPEYPFVADVSSNGRTLLYDNEKFYKHGKPNAKQEQRWICTKFVRQKCRAACSTKEVNGILMMKILTAEHTHDHGDVEKNGDASSSGP